MLNLAFKPLGLAKLGVEEFQLCRQFGMNSLRLSFLLQRFAESLLCRGKPRVQVACSAVRTLKISLQFGDPLGIILVQTQRSQQVPLRVGVPQSSRAALIKQDHMMQDEKHIHEAPQSDELG